MTSLIKNKAIQSIMNATDKVKNLGQIYTPNNIVCDMLNIANYNGVEILQKHIMDNSCGNGAFLVEIVARYICAYKQKHNQIVNLKTELETYIHGIEIDKAEYQQCIDNLNNIILASGVDSNKNSIKWDIVCGDTLLISQYNHQMDFVVGNPPYVRIHNLQDNFNKVRKYQFAQNGMTDLYIVFYEIGLKMLNDSGKLVYITPNSFYSSVAGQGFRDYILHSQQLVSIVDLGHYQPFNATTYTTICFFDKSQQLSQFDYSIYDNGKIKFCERPNLSNAFNNGKMILATQQSRDMLKSIQNYIPQNKNKILVKNAFATLADSIFIQKEFDFISPYIIDICKASTSEYKKCIYPYDSKGQLIPFEKLDKSLQNYLNQNKTSLSNRSLDKRTEWYAYGRSQAISDVPKPKIAINTTIKNINSIKINSINPNCGVYSGLYIVIDTNTDISTNTIKTILMTQEFIQYIATIGKCKSGGYFTFSSNDLKQYLLYKLQI